MSLLGKKIVLGITGSIAAYKAAVLIRLLIKKGAEVQVVITPAGKEFITPITLSALTSKPVISEFFAQRDGSWHSHVPERFRGWPPALSSSASSTSSSPGKSKNSKSSRADSESLRTISPPRSPPAPAFGRSTA